MIQSVKSILYTNFTKLLLVNILWLSCWAITGSLFEVYFFNIGVSITDIYLSSIFWFFGGTVLIPLFRKFEAKKMMLLGISCTFFAVVVLFFLQGKEAAFAFRFLVGLPHFLFWVPYTTMYYEFRKQNNAFLGAVYFSITPILSFVLPALAGGIVKVTNYSFLFEISLIFYALTFLVALIFLKKKEYEYDIVSSLKYISGLKSLFFLEGFASTLIVAVTLDTMLLLYTQKPEEFGGFLSLATLSSIVASLVIGKISDRYKTRRFFIFITCIGFAISSILTSQTTGVFGFFIGFSAINFFKTLFFPLTLALAVDNTKHLVSTMIGREFMFGLGRIVGAIISYIILINSNLHFVLLFQGVAILLYVPLLENRKKKLSSF